MVKSVRVTMKFQKDTVVHRYYLRTRFHTAELLTRFVLFGFFKASIDAFTTVKISIWNRTWSPAETAHASFFFPSVALTIQTGPSTYSSAHVETNRR